MLIIRNEQMDAFRNSLSRKFHNRVLGFVRGTFPPERLQFGPAELEAATDQAIQAATDQGIKRDSYVVGFVCLYLVFGPDFHRVSPLDEIWGRMIDAESKIADSFKFLSIDE
jgi:hypothetical protein